MTRWDTLATELDALDVAAAVSGDARYAYLVPANTEYWLRLSGPAAGALTADLQLPADAFVKRLGDFAKVDAGGELGRVWFPWSSLQSTVVGDDNAKSKTFPMTSDEVTHLLDQARGQGMDVTTTSANAYTIDTHKAGVKLDATYDPDAQKATITIDAPFYVPKASVWSALAPLLPSHVAQAAPAPAAPSGTTQAASSPPPTTTDAEGHVSYLEQAQKRISDAWSAAKALPKDAKQAVKDRAAQALNTAQDLARDVEQGTRDMGAALHDRAVAIKEKLKKLAKTVGGAWLAGGVLVWAVVAFVAYEFLKDEGRRESVKRVGAAALA